MKETDQLKSLLESLGHLESRRQIAEDNGKLNEITALLELAYPGERQ